MRIERMEDHDLKCSRLLNPTINIPCVIIPTVAA